jgi:sulfur carrier protein ThiS
MTVKVWTVVVGMGVRVMLESRLMVRTLMKVVSTGAGNVAIAIGGSPVDAHSWQEAHLRSQHPAANSNDEHSGPDG